MERERGGCVYRRDYKEMRRRGGVLTGRGEEKGERGVCRFWADRRV